VRLRLIVAAQIAAANSTEEAIRKGNESGAQVWCATAEMGIATGKMTT